MSRSKKQGTQWEVDVVALLDAVGFPSRRIAEGGSKDIGDVEVLGRGLVVECKDMGALNVHEAVAKAARKADTDGKRSVLAWKRKKRKPGNTHRSSVGKPIVAMDMETFLLLLGLGPGRQARPGESPRW